MEKSTQEATQDTYRYHVLDDPGLVYYTQSIYQVFAKQKDLDTLNQKYDQEVKSKLDGYDERITTVEETVTSTKNDLEQKFNTLQQTTEQKTNNLEPRVQRLETSLEGIAEFLEAVV